MGQFTLHGGIRFKFVLVLVCVILVRLVLEWANLRVYRLTKLLTYCCTVIHVL